MYKGKTFLAVITARGGSKRIPRKNVKLLSNKPLLAWTIESAKLSKFIDKTSITSENRNILQIATSSGVDILVKRPYYLAKDSSESMDCIIHLMDYIEKIENKRYDYIVLLQPTSPFRSVDQVDVAIKTLINSKKADSLVSFRKIKIHLSWLVEKNTSGMVRKLFKTGRFSSKTEHPDLWEYNGAIYIGKWDNIRKYKSFETMRTLLFEMDSCSSIDLDTKEDWRCAEFLLKEGLVKC